MTNLLKGKYLQFDDLNFSHKSLNFRSIERANRRVVGDPFDFRTEQGPQIDQIQMNKILGLIKTGVDEGATLMAGGERLGDRGCFVAPTVFADVKDHHTIAQEEV